MLKRIILGAAALLAIQLGLVLYLQLFSSSQLYTGLPDTAFLSFDPKAVTAVLITAGDGKTLTLEKNSAGWLMPQAYSAPADKKQVEELLDKVAKAKQGLALAATNEAAKRFKTAPEQFERHLVLKAGSTLVADFYLGSAAGFKQSYVRRAKSDEVFSIPVSSYEAEAEADKWLDKSLGRLKQDELSKLAIADIVLVRADKDWQLEGGQADPEKLAKALEQLTGLNVQAVLDPATVAPLFQQPPAVQITATKQGGETVTLAVVKQDKYAVLKSSTSVFYFKIDNWQAEALLQLKRADILVSAPPSAAAPTSTPPQAITKP